MYVHRTPLLFFCSNHGLVDTELFKAGLRIRVKSSHNRTRTSKKSWSESDLFFPFDIKVNIVDLLLGYFEGWLRIQVELTQIRIRVRPSREKRIRFRPSGKNWIRALKNTRTPLDPDSQPCFKVLLYWDIRTENQQRQDADENALVRPWTRLRTKEDQNSKSDPSVCFYKRYNS